MLLTPRVLAQSDRTIPTNNSAHLKKYQALAPPDKRVHPTETNALQQTNIVSKEVTPETCALVRPAAKAKDIVSAPPAGETDSCLEMQREFVPQHAPASRLNFSEDHGRSSLDKRCPPAQDMDPLCSFLMLRTQEASPVDAEYQNPAGPPGGTMRQLIPIRFFFKYM